ncbi:MAG: glycoside hydrolase [Spirochaetaceae bacterium 4572_7]|nr:MAG: glycoside hydrolase [Spirochaetaceae bacterium 4572_7]
MSIKKRVLKSKPECKVTFVLDKEACSDAETVTIVGDFNNWNRSETQLKKSKNGDFTVTMNLASGKDYQYRYLINDNKWINDWNADSYAPTEYDSENSVVSI